MKKSVKILIIVLCLIIVGLVTFIVVDKVINKKVETPQANDEKIVNTTSNTNKTDNSTSNESDNNSSIPEDKKDNLENSNTLQNQIAVQNDNDSLNIKDSEYAKEYIKIIDNIEKDKDYDDITCDLIYFNNDNIPDLVIGNPGYWVSLYIYEDGNVYNLIDDWAYGIMGNAGYSYIEKKGIVLNHNSDFAGAISIDSILILNSKNEFDGLCNISKGADIEKTDPMYEDVQKTLAETEGYSYNGETISEQEYNDKLKELSINPNDYSASKILEGSQTTAELKKQLQ